MKKIRTVISIILVCCVSAGWVLTLSGNIKDLSENNNNIELARSYVEKGLYQKAIDAYETALDYKENDLVRDELLNAYDLGLQDGVVKSSKYTEAYLEACEKHPKNNEYWEKLLDYYVLNSSYSKAYDVYKKVVRAGVKSEKLTQLEDKILYSYSVKPTNYSSFLRSPNGYFAVLKDDSWGILRPNAEIYSQCAFEYIAPMSSAGNSVLISSKGTRVYNFSGVVQYILSDTFYLARSYGNGLIPVCVSENKWGYYSAESDSYTDGTFSDASSFTSSKAVVKTNDKWKIINTQMKTVSEQSFDDVKLYQNGEYTYKDVMIASSGGKYKIFDASGNEISDFSANDMDNYYGEYIAYKDSNGLWGFVDKEGKVVIEPQFKEAKSFSKGLAAVSDGNKWGFIKTNGQVVIDYQYKFVDYFTSSGFCMVGDEVGAFYMIELRFA